MALDTLKYCYTKEKLQALRQFTAIGDDAKLNMLLQNAGGGISLFGKLFVSKDTKDCLKTFTSQSTIFFLKMYKMKNPLSLRTNKVAPESLHLLSTYLVKDEVTV